MNINERFRMAKIYCFVIHLLNISKLSSKNLKYFISDLSAKINNSFTTTNNVKIMIIERNYNHISNSSFSYVGKESCRNCLELLFLELDSQHTYDDSQSLQLQFQGWQYLHLTSVGTTCMYCTDTRKINLMIIYMYIMYILNNLTIICIHIYVYVHIYVYIESLNLF